MNSVSMARRPAARAAAATSATLPCWSTMAGSLWLRPVTRRRGVVGRLAVLGAVRERHRAVALGQALAVRAEHERNVRVARRRKPEALRQPQLARGGVEEIRAAYHFADALLGVVDDHRHVVRDRAIVAPYDEVVDHALLLSGDPVAKSDARPAGSHAQRRCAAARAPLGALALGERQAGAGIGPIR